MSSKITISIEHYGSTDDNGEVLTVTVRTTPPLAPSRAMARETAFTTSFCINDKILMLANWITFYNQAEEISNWAKNYRSLSQSFNILNDKHCINELTMILMYYLALVGRISQQKFTTSNFNWTYDAFSHWCWSHVPNTYSWWYKVLLCGHSIGYYSVISKESTVVTEESET